MEDPKPSAVVARRLEALYRQRQKILAAPPQDALRQILDDPQALALVRSFPEQDFYLLLNDIGPEDAMELMALASDRQWEYVLDLEAWSRDRVDDRSLTQWAERLQRCDGKRLVQWLAREKPLLMNYLTTRNLQVVVREHDQDAGDIPDDFFTFDGTYYIRISDNPSAVGSEDASGISAKQRLAFWKQLLQDLAQWDYTRFLKIIQEEVVVTAPEAEEELYRHRKIRLAEKGLLPFDEAIAIYQPLTAKPLHPHESRYKQTRMEAPSPLHLPQLPLQQMPGEHLFSRALQRVEAAPLREKIEAELVALANTIIVADQRRIESRKDLAAVVEKAGGYLNIGLEQLLEGNVDAGKAAGHLKKVLVSDIFRAGYSAALDLHWQAQHWLDQSWFGSRGFSLAFWDQEWMGFLGGLLLKRPLYYDNYVSGELFREFRSTTDLDVARQVLHQAMAIDTLLAGMEPQIQAVGTSRGYLNYKNLLLTLWCRHYLGLSDEVVPVPLPFFKSFFSELFPARAGTKDAVPAVIRDEMKTAFLDWLAAGSKQAPQEISANLGNMLEELFQNIAEEYGGVAADDLDPRHLHLFLVQADTYD